MEKENSKKSKEYSLSFHPNGEYKDSIKFYSLREAMNHIKFLLDDCPSLLDSLSLSEFDCDGYAICDSRKIDIKNLLAIK